MAVGLGSMDMPVPAVASWEWLNWKFPRAVHAGDTIYARWTLTQKRAPVGGEPTAIVVWRVDVHTADGALCAEGEVGASVLRNVGAPRTQVAESAEVAGVAAPAPRRRGRRRAPAGDGAKKPIEPKPATLVTPAVPAAASGAGSTASPGGRPRRRRRRRSPGSAAGRNGDTPAAAAPVEAPTAPASLPAAAPAERMAGGEQGANPLTRAIRRLRRP